VVLRNYESRVFEYPEDREGRPLFKPSENFALPELV
jgi:hypothetical protein